MPAMVGNWQLLVKNAYGSEGENQNRNKASNSTDSQSKAESRCTADGNEAVLMLQSERKNRTD